MEADSAKQKNVSTSSTSPILQRTSDIFDEDFRYDDMYRYDSVSVISGSTVANSEFVENQIREYEKKQKTAEAINNPTVQYNLHIGKFVIDAKNKKQELDKEFASKIFSTVQASPDSFKPQKDTKWAKIKEKARKPKLLFPSLLIIILLIGLSIGIPLAIKKDPGNEVPPLPEDTTPNYSTSSPSTSTPTTTPSNTTPGNTVPSTPETTTTPTTTTPDPPIDDLHIVKKSEWIDKGLDLQGRYKQITPVKKVLVTTTKTEPCNSKETCKEVIANLQLENYPDFDDIRENFLIASTGMIFTGRGFDREGEAVIFEDTKTSFDASAISISFMITDENEQPGVMQKDHFCRFLNYSMMNGKLVENYKVFDQSMLLGANENLIDITDCAVKWEKTPEIVKRREWNAKEFPSDNDFDYRRRSSKVIIATSDDRSCDSYETCISAVKTLQESTTSGEIDFNFIFGPENLIFEGRNFDPAISSDFYDSLYLLVLGNISTDEEAVTMFKQIEEFLKFSIDVSKLSVNYKLYGERQVKDGTTSPGDKLFKIIESNEHFDEVFEFYCFDECLK